MIVRKGLPKDLAFIVQCQLDMAQETENIQLDQEVLLKGVNAVFRDSSKGQYWIVEQNESPVGMCLTIPEWSDWRNGIIVWVHSVYVIPNLRGHGVYRLLHKFIQEMVSANADLKGIRLYVDKRNQVAQTVYKRMGMTSDHYDLYEWLK